ncbi:MAG TPA: UMP kinase [Xanthobacteraceae bacterium]|nr:UMP kinase [Xanthobacteraceae bacterium]
MPSTAYRRVVIKVSGEALSGNGTTLDQTILERIAADLAAARDLGVSIGVVIGGGNFVRGVSVASSSIARARGDSMGMLATIMNAIALEGALEGIGVPARTVSALAMPQVCETYRRDRTLRHLEAGRIVLLAGGTANPFFTTDTTAVLRACELGADAVLKATNVDGIYSADPRRDKNARRYERLTHSQALSEGLKVMDATAFALARENRMPIIVFAIAAPGAIAATLKGEGRATIVEAG